MRAPIGYSSDLAPLRNASPHIGGRATAGYGTPSRGGRWSGRSTTPSLGEPGPPRFVSRSHTFGATAGPGLGLGGPALRVDQKITRTSTSVLNSIAMRGAGAAAAAPAEAKPRTPPRDEGPVEKIVFLDVDGVLHPYHARPNQLFRKDCMMRLKKIIQESGAKIVLSTSWRRTAKGRSEVNAQLQRYGIPTAIDHTRIRHNEYLRNEEVTHWIRQHPSTTHWIAIDDLPMPQLGEHYIRTMPDRGITDVTVGQALRVLTSPMHANLLSGY